MQHVVCVQGAPLGAAAMDCGVDWRLLWKRFEFAVQRRRHGACARGPSVWIGITACQPVRSHWHFTALWIEISSLQSVEPWMDLDIDIENIIDRRAPLDTSVYQRAKFAGKFCVGLGMWQQPTLLLQAQTTIVIQVTYWVVYGDYSNPTVCWSRFLPFAILCNSGYDFVCLHCCVH